MNRPDRLLRCGAATLQVRQEKPGVRSVAQRVVLNQHVQIPRFARRAAYLPQFFQQPGRLFVGEHLAIQLQCRHRPPRARAQLVYILDILPGALGRQRQVIFDSSQPHGHAVPRDTAERVVVGESLNPLAEFFHVLNFPAVKPAARHYPTILTNRLPAGKKDKPRRADSGRHVHSKLL